MIPVIDLFAGPGGLNEGFSKVLDHDGNSVFRIVASFEMDQFAHATLVLRTALRLMSRDGQFPSDYYKFLKGELTWAEFAALPLVTKALNEARDEVHQIELGPETRRESDQIIDTALARSRSTPETPWVLIGGPPCQAYSMAGRSRRTKDELFEEDKKHFLFREYLHIIEKFKPPIFVMENVTGLLSSTHGGKRMFDRILSDLSLPEGGPDYEIRSLVVQGESLKPQDFVIRAEEFGVPQRRHRVILLGIRKGGRAVKPCLLQCQPPVSVRVAIGKLPKIRSSLSPRSIDGLETWKALRDFAKEHAGALPGPATKLTTGSQFAAKHSVPEGESIFSKWILDPAMPGVTLHEARSHMKEDLVRYAYLAVVAKKLKRSPQLHELPHALLPAHKNVGRVDTPFTDRFRVQLWDVPSTTIVSHISKDGHYYIHPDPNQMRSLTVREAARLQTFPDNYFFMGSRTQQYHQVGNAVPPLLAHQIAANVAGLLGLDIVG